MMESDVFPHQKDRGAHVLELQLPPRNESSLGIAGSANHRTDAGEVREAIPVCHVCLGPATGGLERFLVEFSRLHAATRFRPQLVALGEPGRSADEMRANGCDVTALDFEAGKLAVLRELSERLRDAQVPIVHTHNTEAHFYGTLAAKRAGVPVVINTQHGPSCGPTWKRRRQFRIANRWTQRIVAVSDDVAALCGEEDPRSEYKMMRIGCGIDVARFRERDAAQLPEVPSAICIARLSSEEDVPTLLCAVAGVVREIPEFRLQIVGDGPERDTLEQLTEQLLLGESVAFLGERTDVTALLARAGFFVSSPRAEHISLNLLEAAAVGLPIVTTSVGDHPQVVQDGKNGFLVPPQQPFALAEAIVRMCHNRDRWPTMGRHGRAWVQRHFDVRRMIAAYETLYAQLLPAAP
jgi:glycosyltransferase involved in cell wall biosynthesis